SSWSCTSVFDGGQHFRHPLRGPLGGRRVLSGDQGAVRDRERRERERRLPVGGPALPALFLDVVGDELVDERQLLLPPGETGDLAAVEKQGAVRQPGVEQTAVSVADRGDDAPGLEDPAGDALEVGV